MVYAFSNFILYFIFFHLDLTIFLSFPSVFHMFVKMDFIIMVKFLSFVSMICLSGVVLAGPSRMPVSPTSECLEPAGPSHVSVTIHDVVEELVVAPVLHEDEEVAFISAAAERAVIEREQNREYINGLEQQYALLQRRFNDLMAVAGLQ